MSLTRPSVNLVRQEGDYDCGLACLAMVLRLPSPRDVVPLLGRHPDEDVSHLTDDLAPMRQAGLTSEEIRLVLWEQGIAHFDWVPDEVYRTANVRWRWDLRDKLHVMHEDQLTEYLLRGETAILGVGSLNFRNGAHWVVASGLKIFDPAPEGRWRYESLADERLQPTEAILIKATRH